jgi:hypothetical protein
MDAREADFGQSRKTVFVCSKRCPGNALLHAIDWVKSLDPAATTLLGGWHTPVEREVLRLALLRGVPVIIAEARSPRTVIPPAWRAPLAEGRLHIVHPFSDAGPRITAAQAAERTRWVLAHARYIVVAHASPGGTLASALAATTAKVLYLAASK